MNATIQIPYEQFKTMEREIAQLKRDLANLRAKSQSNRHRGDSDLVEALDRAEAAMRYAIPVVQFAVGNLNPESNRGWPHEDLRKLAVLLPQVVPTWTEVETLARSFREAATAAAEVDGIRTERLAAAKVILGVEDK